MNKSIKRMLWIYTGGLVLVFVLHRILPSKHWLWILVPAYFLYLPLFAKENLTELGLRYKEWKGGLKDFIITSLIVFPPFAVGFKYFSIYFLGRPFVPGFSGNVANMILGEIFYVGLPEEFFYRGYIQGVLRKYVDKKRIMLFGCPLTMSILITSILFAIGHFVIDFNPARFSVFFPALLFGCLKERRNDLTASTLFHATSNIVMKWLMG